MEFCCSFLGCKISTGVPCVDGYEISNLISNQNAGFIGESFVRPPANIRLEFPLPIDIANVQLETQMGERKVTSFKLSSISNLPNEVKKTPCEDQGGGSRISNSFLTRRNNKNCSFSKFTSQQHETDDFFLGRWFSVSQSNVFLKNYHYKHWLSIPLCNDDEAKSSCYTGALRNSERKALNSVQSLILTISCVSPTGPPVLKSIKVWGQPSLSSSPSQRNKIICLWHKKNKQAKLPSGIYGSNKPPDKEEKADLKDGLAESTVVPEEFLDPLTCDIMRLPVLLPSGNSIDSSSLDRFVGHEATWGRPASDPFTGVPFKQNYKPEPNVYLKVRIDRFLLIEKDLTEPLLKGKGHVVSDSPELYPDVSEVLQVKKRRRLGVENSRTKIVTIHSLKKSESLDGATCSKSSSNRVTSYPAKIQPFLDTSCESSLATSSSSSTKEKKSQPKETQKSGKIISSNDHSGHSLIKTLGSAISSASMMRRSSSGRVQVKRNTPSTSNSPIIELSKSLDVPKDNYSLTSISANALKCFCGSVSSVFYSMDCSHNICSNCVRLEMKLPPFDVIKCKECHQVSNKNNLRRAHPKSAFAL